MIFKLNLDFCFFIFEKQQEIAIVCEMSVWTRIYHSPRRTLLSILCKLCMIDVDVNDDGRGTEEERYFILCLFASAAAKGDDRHWV